MPTSPVVKSTRVENRAARRSLLLGVISIPAAMVTIGALTGLVAIAQGVTGIKHANDGEGRPGQAIAGVVLGVIAVAMVVLYYTVGND